MASEDRFVHRLEAFSDIVIGFSLAQLGAALVIPAHAARLVEDPGWFFLFAWTFALVCLMWWNHNRIFRNGFTVTRLSLLLNFLLLASVVLIVYFAQVYGRIDTLNDATVAGRLYFGALAFSTTVTALLYAFGSHLGRGVIVNGVSAAVQWLAVAASLVVGENAWMLGVMGTALLVSWFIGAMVARQFATRSA